MYEVKKCIRRENEECVQLSKFCPIESDCTVHYMPYTGDKAPNNKVFICSNYCCDAK